MGAQVGGLELLETRCARHIFSSVCNYQYQLPSGLVEQGHSAETGQTLYSHAET